MWKESIASVLDVNWLPQACGRRECGALTLLRGAVSAWRHLRFAFEHHAQIFHVLEARALRDRGQRRVGIGKKLPNAIQAHSLDLLMRRAAERPLEPLVERASRERHRGQNIVHADS